MSERSDRFAGIRQEILEGMEKRVESRAAAFELRKQFLDSKTGKIGQMMKEMKNTTILMGGFFFSMVWIWAALVWVASKNSGDR